MSVELEKGMRISALRMSNKAVKLTGTLESFSDDGKTVGMAVDGAEGHIETVHVNDVTPLETPAEVAADLRSEGVDAAATPHGIVVDVPKDDAPQSFTTYNGKPI